MATAPRWPTSPPAWLLPWLIWRFRYGGIAGSPPAPAGTPALVPPYAWGVAKWCGWRRKGAIPPRPASTEKAPIPDKIPPWGWAIERDLRIAVPLKPPPPPPPPANPIPPSSWSLPLPLAFTAWGWMTDSDFRNVEVAAQRMVDAGVGTVALRIGMFEPDVPGRLRAFGLKVALWNISDSRDQAALEAADADGLILQIEGVSQFDSAIAALEAGVGAGRDCSIVTTLAGLETYTRRPDGTADGHSTTFEVERLVDAGITHAFVECYAGNMEPLDVGTFMDSAKRIRGLYHATPVPGLAGRDGIYFSTYSPDLDAYGRQIGVYLAEPMRPIDWTDLRAL
jgi:hypothetical protein